MMPICLAQEGLMTGTTLKRGVRITIRDLTPALRKVVTHTRGLERWQGDRLSVVFASYVVQPTFSEYLRSRGWIGPGSERDATVQVMSLVTGGVPRAVARSENMDLMRDPVQILDAGTAHETAWVNVIAPAQAAIVLVRKKDGRRSQEPWRNADLTFYIDQWHQDHTQLDAARDAALDRDYERAIKCAKQVIPHAAALFVAVCAKERKQHDTANYEEGP